MGIVNRTPGDGKTSGSDWASGDQFRNTAINNDLNTIYNEFNGNISNANILAGAAIAWTKVNTAGQVMNVDVAAAALIDPEKIDDQADNEATFKTLTNPGSSGAPTLPTGLHLELQSLRYVLRQALLGGTSRLSTGAVNAGWFDGAVREGNLLFNPNFLVWNSASPTIGDGWTASGGAVGTATGTALGAGDETEGLGSCLRIIDGTGGRGIEQVLSGLKAGARYLISVRVRPAVNQVTLSTLGAAAGTFTDLALTSASGTGAWETLSGLVQADAAGANITVRLRGVAAASDWKCTHFRARPVEVDPFADPGSLIDYDTSADDGNAGPLTVSSLDAVVKVPSSGYIILAAARVTARQSNAGNDGTATVLLTQNAVTVATGVIGIPTGATGAAEFASETILFHVNLNPTPGTTYTYACTFTGGGGDALETNGANAPHQIFALALKL